MKPGLIRRLFVFTLLCNPIWAALPPYFSPYTLPLSESTYLSTFPQANPAYFTQQDETGTGIGLGRNGSMVFYSANPLFGTGIFTRGAYTTYSLHTGWEKKGGKEGVGLTWQNGPGATQGLAVQWGQITRPNEKTSIGLMGIAELGSGGGIQGILDLGFRPSGTDALTLGSTFVLDNARSSQWSLYAASSPLKGLSVACRYTDDKTLSVGVEIQFGDISVQSHGGPDSMTMVHFHSEKRADILENWNPSTSNRTFMQLELGDKIKYQRYKWFDESQTLYDILSTIDQARKNPKVSGLLINATEFDTSPTFTWEIRNALEQFKKSGKSIVVFIENAETQHYYFASVANWIVLDPMGVIYLPGSGITRTYWKGLLDKVGIGVEELRLFKYKTAYQGFVESQMSDADKEQLGAFITSNYTMMVNDIARGRKVSPNIISSWNAKCLFTAKESLKFGLVDELGRWKDAKARLASFNASTTPANSDILDDPKDTYWGEHPVIAVIYAEGVCAMDTGISARRLVKTLEAAIESTKVKAIVLRIDSPGGSAQASDIVAQAIKTGKEKKPIIISQGEYAASGGYYISAYGTQIISAPTTKTGSIGVIAMRFYSKGLESNIGVTPDGVYIGEHGDLNAGLTLPILNLKVPKRNLTPEEKSIYEALIRSSYKDFVELVADARKKTPEQIETVAQGRIWAGSDALTHGLVDQLGGLDFAIAVAKKEAKLSEDQKVRIIQLPQKGLFNLQGTLKTWSGIPDFQAEMEQLRFYEKHNGKVMPMM
jgi:protease-4